MLQTTIALVIRHAVFHNSTRLNIPWKCKKNLRHVRFPFFYTFHSSNQKRALLSCPFFRALRHLETRYILSLAFLQLETESRNYAESIALVKRRIHILSWYFCTDVTFLCPVRCITKLSGILFCSPRVAIVAWRLWGNKLSSEKVF